MAKNCTLPVIITLALISLGVYTECHTTPPMGSSRQTEQEQTETSSCPPGQLVYLPPGPQGVQGPPGVQGPQGRLLECIQIYLVQENIFIWTMSWSPCR